MTELLDRLRDQFSPEERRALIVALLAERGAEATPERREDPPVERLSSSQWIAQPGPGMKGGLDDPEVSGAAEGDSPEWRAKLLAILQQFPSGVSGYTLLDQYGIPPETIELARREGQVGRADRGLGLTHEWGGPWARDTENVDMAAIARHEKRFREILESGKE